MSSEFIPFHRPTIGENEIQSVVDTLKSGWLTTGPKVKRFEEDFARYLGCTHAIAVNSGTAALHLALDAIGIQEGDDVIVPTMTFAATAEVVIYFKANPVLVDCQPRYSQSRSESDRASHYCQEPKRLFPSTLAASPAIWTGSWSLPESHNFKVIEDAAHALPAAYHGKKVGTIGDITCFSFYATKTITTGEGGMATTENPEWANRMRIMSLHGISLDAWDRYTDKGSWYYEIIHPGYKYNLTDIAAALGIEQLKRCDEFWEARRRIASHYHEAFADLGRSRFRHACRTCQHAWHLYVIQLNIERLRINRQDFIEALKSENIGTSVHFIPLHLHPYYRDKFGYQTGGFSSSKRRFRAHRLPADLPEDDRSRRPRRHRRCEKAHPGVPSVMKRAFDIIVTLTGLILLFPLLLIVALLIKCDSKGPVFFKQERIGKGFHPFWIYKFRTMRQATDGPPLTVGQDPRITRIGWLLRKTKVDELPQLINVLKGEMSLVGPRPEVRKYVELFRRDYEKILKVRPGVTDMASLKYQDEAKCWVSLKIPKKNMSSAFCPIRSAWPRNTLAARRFSLILV